MVSIITITTFMFVFYFLASFNTLKETHRLVFVVLFLVSCCALRLVITPEINKDYYGYFTLYDFAIPKDIMSFLLGEPYLKSVYAFFNLFTDDKVLILKGIYWFNFIFTTSFFTWILTRKDIQMWKKILLFSFFYFLFAFILIRNAPAYILFGCYFYYSYREDKFNWVLLTPLMHISSAAVLATYFHKKKHYFLFFAILAVVLMVLLVLVLPTITNSLALEMSMSKLDTYSAEMEVVSIFHKLYFVFISGIVTATAIIYKKEILHPIIITSILLYYISFVVNPVVGFRFTPYLFFSILFYNYNGAYNKSFTRIFNIICFLLLPYFIHTLLDTHYL